MLTDWLWEVTEVCLKAAAFGAPNLEIIFAAGHMGFGATRPPC